MRARVDPIPNPWGLSGMQCKVLGFVVEGLTAREIATEMLVIERTVENHLARAHKKMAVRRSILAALMWDRFTRDAGTKDPQNHPGTTSG